MRLESKWLLQLHTDQENVFKIRVKYWKWHGNHHRSWISHLSASSISLYRRPPTEITGSCLQRSQRHRWANFPKAEGRVDLCREGGVDGVEVERSVWGNIIKGQSSSRTIHVHSYSVGEGCGGGGWWGGRRVWGGRRGEGRREGGFFAIVPDRVTLIRAAQTPGLVSASKLAMNAVSFPLNPSVCQCYVN